jgi:thiol:disulfide interchange protein
MRFLTAILILLAALAGPAARAAHTAVNLILPAAAQSGGTVLVGVALKMEPGWHTYWKNPGEAGQATQIHWTLPAGISAGEIQWPLPEKLPPAEVTTYGYQNEAVLLVPLKIGADLPATPVNLSAKVSWLECKDSCVPASAEISGKLLIGSPAGKVVDAAAAKLLADWQKKVPATIADLSAVAWWEKTADDKTRTLVLNWPGKGPGDFYPSVANDNYQVDGATTAPAAPAGQIEIRKSVKKFSGDWPKALTGVFVSVAQAIEAPIKISDGPPVAAAVTAPPAPAQPLWRMLLFAFLGGLILNLMPCVLPVIALKILGFVSEAKSAPGHVRRLGVAYTIGVLASFAVLGGAVVAVKLAGHQAAWGMQFGNPIFLVSLVTLVTLVALNLFGVFEVTLGDGAMTVAGELSAKSGLSGAFFNGALATALATPCSAPILGSALAFAFTQPASTLVLIFLTVGLGLASPYLALSGQPAWLRFLPKPGAWMEKFKVAMGFPMLAAVLWLYNVAAATYGKNILWLGVFLVCVAAAAWTFGNFVQRGSKRQELALAVVLLLLTIGYGCALEKELDWRHPVIEANSGALKESADGIDWQPWSAVAVAQARAAGRMVLVDFTADWCLTCQVNKKTSLEIPSVREKLKALGAVTLLADYTHTPDVITTELARYHRAGVPLVLVYPQNPAAAPIVLPEVLTPGLVLNALDQAAN